MVIKCSAWKRRKRKIRGAMVKIKCSAMVIKLKAKGET